MVSGEVDTIGILAFQTSLQVINNGQMNSIRGVATSLFDFTDNSELFLPDCNNGNADALFQFHLNARVHVTATHCVPTISLLTRMQFMDSSSVFVAAGSAVTSYAAIEFNSNGWITGGCVHTFWLPIMLPHRWRFWLGWFWLRLIFQSKRQRPKSTDRSFKWRFYTPKQRFDHFRAKYASFVPSSDLLAL